ncbi:MAG: hypothetical protein JJE52_18580 [Acidimicrobiia bacterium]|nr:hypothetical protein [Acidimicrobiia bacterium]
MSSIHVAASDCERIRPGLIAQPANTASSLAFVLAARPMHRRAEGRWAWRVVAVATAAVGIGSVAYHGPGGRFSKLVHDGAIVALVASLGVAEATATRRRPPSPRTALLASSALVLHTLSRTGGPLCSCNSPLQGHALFHGLAAAALWSSAEDSRAQLRLSTTSTPTPVPKASRPGGGDTGGGGSNGG